MPGDQPLPDLAFAGLRAIERLLELGFRCLGQPPPAVSAAWHRDGIDKLSGVKA